MKIFSVVLFVFINFKGIRLDNKLNIEVLFESLCPDSLKFVREQLYPHWPELTSYINLKLVPFGKSSSLEGGTKFVCQHGPQECKGNRIMSCALNRMPDQNLQVEFVACFMEIFKMDRSNPQQFGQLCAMEIELDFDEVMNCYNGEEGTITQLKAEQATTKFSPKFIPTVLYNGQFVQQLQDESLIDFKGVICRLISNVFPEACQRSNSNFSLVY